MADPFRLIWPLAAVAALAAAPVHAEAVVCHYTYGGETRTLAARPVTSPYGVAPVAVGSYFQFRVVFQKEPADLASIKVYAYADLDSGLTPLHQATFPYPSPAIGDGRFGFTGLHFVYEPMRDGELQYWCAMGEGSGG